LKAALGGRRPFASLAWWNDEITKIRAADPGLWEGQGKKGLPFFPDAKEDLEGQD